MTAKEYCQTIVKEIEKANEELEIRVKLILAIDRRRLKDCEDTVKIFHDLKEKHGDVMAGIDLSGDPRYTRWFLRLESQAEVFKNVESERL